VGYNLILDRNMSVKGGSDSQRVLKGINIGVSDEELAYKLIGGWSD